MLCRFQGRSPHLPSYLFLGCIFKIKKYDKLLAKVLVSGCLLYMSLAVLYVGINSFMLITLCSFEKTLKPFGHLRFNHDSVWFQNMVVSYNWISAHITHTQNWF